MGPHQLSSTRLYVSGARNGGRLMVNGGARRTRIPPFPCRVEGWLNLCGKLRLSLQENLSLYVWVEYYRSPLVL